MYSQTLDIAYLLSGCSEKIDVSESVRHMWNLSLNHTSSVHCAMIYLMGCMVVKTNNQHVDVTEPRWKQDLINYKNLKRWLK